MIRRELLGGAAATWQAQLLTRQLDDLSLLLARFLMTPPSVNAQFILFLFPEES